MDRAVSGSIGIALMLVITIISAGIVGAYVLSQEKSEGPQLTVMNAPGEFTGPGPTEAFVVSSSGGNISGDNVKLVIHSKNQFSRTITVTPHEFADGKGIDVFFNGRDIPFQGQTLSSGDSLRVVDIPGNTLKKGVTYKIKLVSTTSGKELFTGSLTLK